MNLGLLPHACSRNRYTINDHMDKATSDMSEYAAAEVPAAPVFPVFGLEVPLLAMNIAWDGKLRHMYGETTKKLTK